MDENNQTPSDWLWRIFRSSRFWGMFFQSLVYLTPVIILPAALHFIGHSVAALVVFWGFGAFAAGDVFWRLPRFVKAIVNKHSKPFVDWCVLDWSVYAVSALISTLAARFVGLF